MQRLFGTGRTRSRIALGFFLLRGGLLHGCAATSRYGESLVTPTPPGYARTSSTSTDGLEFVEMVPGGQNASSWTEMVAMQTFRGGVEEGDPQHFAAWMAGRWKDDCPQGTVGTIESGTRNGYPAAFWRMDCERTVSTGGPQHVLTLAIEGTYAFYTVQKTWRTTPAENDVASWKRSFFDAVSVCDRRGDAGHPCTGTAAPR